MSDNNMFSQLLKMADKYANNVFKVLTEKDKFYNSIYKKFVLDDISDICTFVYLLMSAYNFKYSWSLIDINLIDDITKFLKSNIDDCNKRCLSIMSGKGHLDNLLKQRDCDIIATYIIGDNNILKNKPTVLNFDKNVLLISWCPYNNTIE